MSPEYLSCRVAAVALVRVAAEDMPARRKAPGPVCGEQVSPAFLKNADEQTVACLAAVLQATHDAGLAPDGPTAFREWGVVAAPRFVGRDVIRRDVMDFLKEGPWGVSPHVIPHRSLHSPSGAVSVALGIRGPNLGAGGGPGGDAEGLLAALALLWERRLPGVWLLLSRVEPLVEADQPKGQLPPGTCAVAAAFALTLAGAGPTLSLEPGDGGPLSAEALLAGRPCAVPGLGRVSLRHAC